MHETTAGRFCSLNLEYLADLELIHPNQRHAYKISTEMKKRKYSIAIKVYQHGGYR